MSDVLSLWASSLGPWTIGEALSRWQQVLFSFDIFAWLFVITVVRFDVPAFVVFVVNAIRPRAFRPPAHEGAWPSVSVLIAGRNPGASIRRTIQSVLDSGYPDIEVLYLDDCSTDDSVVHARSFERAGSVRVFASRQHNGKPANLNVGIAMARGEFAFVLDSDAEVEFGTLHRLAAYLQDPRVGAVAGNILVRNAGRNLLTRLQEVEYALNGSIARLWRAGLGLLPILPGAASMFRMSALRALGGYDNGLGDDTDMTIRMLKAGWRLRFSLDACVWADQPPTLLQLFRQRTRWARNMAKIRLRKHFDFIDPFRYGLTGTIMSVDNIVFRVLLPFYAVIAIAIRLFIHDSSEPITVTAIYGLFLFLILCRVLIANDIARTPPLADVLLLPLYPFYRALLRLVEVIAIARELLRIRLYHPYVPERIWAEIPHW